MAFTDATLSEWPQIVVTNPKDARFLAPTEPVGMMASSSHVRVLIFAPDLATTATVAIDGGAPVELTRVQPGEPRHSWGSRRLVTG